MRGISCVPEQPWFVIDGEMTNSPAGTKPAPGSNLRSKQKFQDYRIHAEYKLDTGSHSGIYFRGRYEMQVLGDVGKPADKFSHMSVYGWAAPLVNASKPDNEWQTMEGTIVANKISVTLNGQKSSRQHDARSDHRRTPWTRTSWNQGRFSSWETTAKSGTAR